MPRPNRGPHLDFLPAKERERQGYKRKIYFIFWTESGRSRRRSTGTDQREKAEQELANFIATRHRPATGKGVADEASVMEMLSLYATEHGPDTRDPDRIDHAILALDSFWAGRIVADIKAATCKEYHRFRRDAGRVDGTIRRELGTLQAAGRWAVKAGHLDSFPQSFWMPPKGAPRDRWLTDDEAHKLLEAARAEPKASRNLPLFIDIALATAARVDSIMSLQWIPNTTGGHVDLDAGVIDFNPEGRTQTKKRRTRIKIPETLVEPLAAQQAITRRHVFEDEAGQPIKSFKRSFATACRRAGLEGVTIHTLSHTAITWLMQWGVAIERVAEYSGKTVETIQRHYWHHHPDYQTDVVEAIDSRRRGRTKR